MPHMVMIGTHKVWLIFVRVERSKYPFANKFFVGLIVL
jgi:hypothetical protein